MSRRTSNRPGLRHDAGTDRLCCFLVLGLSVSARAETIQITIDKLVFAPAELDAKVGDTIEWINKDALVHTATATNGDWNVNIRGEADAGRLVLNKPGVSRVLLQASSQHEGTDCHRALRRG